MQRSRQSVPQQSLQPDAPQLSDSTTAGGVMSNAGNSARASQLKKVALPYRSQMEQSFGRGFGEIEVFTGVGEALTQSGADALAVRDDALLFASSSPSIEQVAHELAHIHQQERRPAASGTSSRGDAAETEATDLGKKVARGESVQVEEAAGGALQGDWQTGAVVGGLLGGPVGAVVGGLIGEALDGPTTDEEIAEFRATDFPTLVDHLPTSGMGMFDVEFDAATGAMRIVLKVSYDFVAGDPSESGPGFRAAEFEWNDEEKEAWRQVYQRDVEALWSGQHTFKSTKEGWDAVVVNTTVDVVEDTADPHFVLSVAKYPPDAGMETSSICPPGTHHDGNGYCPPNTADHHGHAHNTGTASLDSNDMREEAKLGSSHSPSWVFFKKGEADLDSAAKGVIKPVADQLNADASMKVKLTGNASNDHRSGVTPQQGAIENMDIARERSANVAAELTGQGVSSARMIVRNVGEEGHDDNDRWCSVGVRPIDKETQNPALHETGHMFGLGDEYPATDDAGNAVLVKPLYAQMVLDQTGEVVDRSARSESVMSAGSTVQGAHYASFLEALKTITGSQEWSL